MIRLFGLEKDYFALNPKTEFKAYFVKEKKEEVDRLVQDIKRTIAVGRYPKLVVYGALGLGKTHFLFHLKYRLQNVARCIYVETPPSHRRTRFTDLHGVIMREIGRSYVMDILERAVAKAKAAKVSLSRFTKIGGDICDVIQSAIEQEKYYVLWRYLSGEKLRSAEARDIEAVRSQLSEDEAVTVLNTLAYLLKNTEEDKRPMLLLVDEIENTRLIGGDSATLFVEANRSLTDESSNVGIIFAATVRAVAELPRTITEKSVASRIGYTNFIQFKDYSEETLREFITDVINYRRQKAADIGALLKEAQRNTSEQLNEAFYPFTEEAIAEIVSTVSQLYRKGKTDAMGPRETLHIMDACLREASDRPAITSEIVIDVRDELAAKLELIRL